MGLTISSMVKLGSSTSLWGLPAILGSKKSETRTYRWANLIEYDDTCAGPHIFAKLEKLSLEVGENWDLSPWLR